ncbi:Superfamily II DNA or RNA helicase, SNF2 family [Clostridium cavendishii DSM 21758]|uniref:Superfamily II DNA or RNA helicase, SNF2 family n=1 Tax=Clostridium cavendishii DSM 21758 TaxID=1121302 RepID=A0A1M6AJ03_9CLOT|nr:SNF2 helicase associated domain-containing protein [Clostridium cavendishii]SHI36489.1 Superfamily II DNA or RNA helicase, SNF2 family [Clostridium cavendishii DSM 21758]
MNRNDLEFILNRMANYSNKLRGLNVYNSELVNELATYFDEDRGEYSIKGLVDSERNYSEYETEIDINVEKNSIVYTYCDCMDFQNNDMIYNYACKHIIASFYKLIELEKRGEVELPVIKKDPLKFGEYILEALDSLDIRSKDRIRLEVIIKNSGNNHRFYNEAEFKIGMNKLYVMKNIREFSNAFRKGYSLNYGKDFEYNPLKQEFSKEDEELVNYLIGQVEINDSMNSYNGLISGKTLKVSSGNLRGFLRNIKNKKINFQKEGVINAEIAIIEEDMDLSFNIGEDEEGNIVVNSKEELPIPLTNAFDVFLFKSKLYLPSREQIKKFIPIYNVLSKEDEIKFKKENSKKVIEKVIPIVNSIAKNNIIEDNIQSKILKEEFKAEFYLDRDKKLLTINFKCIYGDMKFDALKGYNGELYVLRDDKREAIVFNKLEELGFVVIEGRFVFTGDDEKYYNFLTTGIGELKELGDIFYSDSFKHNVIYTSKSVRAEILKNKQDYLEFSFNIGDIESKEVKNILEAFRENKKFFKLKDDNFIDLADEKLKDFLTVLDNLSEDNKLSNNKLKLNRNKAIYLNSVIEARDIRLIGGTEIVKEISDKIKNIANLRFDLPEGLQAELRGYQKTGYNFFKTLAYYGFGGILADEMGLGKTLQTISFLLGEEEKKSLIVAPTSLIYNWQSEFEKFAPSMKILVLHGNKDEREKLMEEYEEYDVIITTYNLIRNDFEFYKDKNFDYIIIDEAQNIKNPLSQNANAIKEVKGNCKFALTGTPIENSLIELWSIFDFIMPGYLFNQKKFSSRFAKNINNEESLKELDRLIKPFILRRYKRDVMLELPDKIEKRLIVDMTNGQKKAYKAYAEDVKQRLEEMKRKEGLKSKQIEIFSYITKLRQLSLDPSIVLEDYMGGSGKIDALLETLIHGIEEGHKILVFSQFTTVLKNIGDLLDKSRIEYFYLDGSTKAKDRLQFVNDFNEGDTKVFLISLKAGGTGLNLTSADVVIHFDPWWNPAVEDQATDRAHRFGQKNVVEVIKLISKGSIEEKILKLQDAKKEIIEKVMNGEFRNGNVLNELSENEILELFS